MFDQRSLAGLPYIKLLTRFIPGYLKTPGVRFIPAFWPEHDYVICYLVEGHLSKEDEPGVVDTANPAILIFVLGAKTTDFDPEYLQEARNYIRMACDEFSPYPLDAPEEQIVVIAFEDDILQDNVWRGVRVT